MAEDRAEDAQQSEQRWRGRRVQAWLVRALTYLIPLGASVGAGALTSGALPKPTGVAELASWWTIMLTVVTATLLGADRLARRLLPLAALLKLTLIFPDQAPSRFRVAVRAGGTRKLEQKLDDVKTKGLEHTPAEAAATVLELASMLNVHDRRTRGHSERVRVFSDLLADELKLPKHDRDRLHWAALLHDVGKLVVPVDILNKAGKPSEEEWAILQSHPLEGEKFVAPLAEWLGDWANAIGQHHEKYDGTGYPRRLAGHDISVAARIVAVADSYEVMTAARSYKRPMPAAEARRELARCAGTQFDPMVVRAFLNISVGKLRLAMGPLSWAAQLPFAQFLPQVGSAASTAASTAVATASTATAMVLGGVVEAPTYTPSAAAAEEEAAIPAGERPRGQDPLQPPVDLDAGPAPTDPAVTAAEVPARKAPPSAFDDEATVLEDEAVTIAAMGNDVAGDGELLPETMTMTKASAGAAVAAGGGSIRFVPQPDRHGVDRFRYSICDDNGLCDEASVTVRVIPVNDPPVARSDGDATKEDRPISLRVLDNDSDVDGDPLSVVSAYAGVGGVTVNGDGTLTYTPKKDWEGTDSLRYQISDGQGATAVGNVTVVVSGDNDDPEAAPDSGATDEDHAVTVAVTANDRDPDEDPLRVTAVGPAANGTASASGGGVVYTPKKDWSGVDSFTYTVEDGRGGSASSTVTVTVKPVNDKPEAVEDRATVEEDQKVTIDVLANDKDADLPHDQLSVVSAGGDGGATGIGTITVSRDGAVLYAPKADAHGTDTVTYTLRDREGATATGTVVITVTPVNDAPIAENVAATGDQDQPLIPLALSAKDPKDEGRPGYPAGEPIVAYEILTTPAAGTLYVEVADGSYQPAVAGDRTANPVVKFTPPAGDPGAFSFTYRALDAGQPTPGQWTAAATGTFNIVESRLLVSHRSNRSGATPLRDATVHGIAYVFAADAPTMAKVDFWLDDPGTSGAPFHGEGDAPWDFNGGGSGAAAPWDTGTIAPGPHTITARVTRSDGTTFVVSAPFTVVANAVPVPGSDTVSVDEDDHVDIAVLTNDTDGNGDELAATATTPPAHGTVAITSDGRIRYTPDADWNGTDTFTYTVDDGHGASATGTVTVTVLPMPDPPVARFDKGDSNLLGFAAFDVLANDDDVDGDLDPATLAVVTDPAHGTATVKPDHTIHYQADLLAGQGVDRFRYEICDRTGRCAQAEVRVGVLNSAPVAANDAIATQEDTAVTADIVANDFDPDGWDTPLIASVSSAANGSVAVKSNRREIIYTPAPGWSGVDTLTYTISDGLLSSTATVTITVGPVNDPPVATDDAVTTEVDVPILIDVLANDSDVDGNPLTVTAADPAAGGGSVAIVGNKVEYTPPPGTFGTDTFDYTVSDGTVTDTATVHVTINALPVAGADTATIDEDSAERDIDVLANDSDPDGGTLTVSAVAGATKGIVTAAGDHLHYTPNPDANGSDSFTYTLTDGTSSVQGMVTVTINPLPDAPVAADDDATTTADTAVTIDPLVNDTDADGDLVPGSVTLTAAPAVGTATVDAVAGAITYTPAAGWSGLATFGYRVCDGTGACAVATVRVTVRRPPKAVDDAFSVEEDHTVVKDVLANDIVGDGAIASVTIITPPTKGQVTVLANKQIQYNPDDDVEDAVDTLTYQICDVNGQCSTATVTITIFDD